MNRLYVLSRKDIGVSQQAVQSGHAVAQFMLEHPDQWKNSYLILLEVKNINELEKYKYIFQEHNVPHASFREPDRENELTAIAGLNAQHLCRKLQLI